MSTLFQAFGGAFIVIAFATLIWPLNIPIAAGAYKVYFSAKPLPFEPKEFWIRSTVASLGLGLLTLVSFFILYMLIDVVELKDLQGEIVIALFLLYLPAAVAGVFFIFALEDMVQAAGIFFLYVLMPGLPFLLIYWLAHLSTKFSAMAPWLMNFSR
jgi:hypothetical protein